MTKRIDVPGVGIVEFPDNMSDEQITNAIRNNIMPKYSAQMETPTQTFGRSAASLADTAINTVRGIADIPVRAVSRAYYGGLKGVPLEQQEPLLQKVSNAILPQQDVVGRAFGVTGTPGYEQAPLRQLGTYAGETIGQNVIQPLAQATGLPEGYVGDVVNLGTAAVAPAIPKVAKVAATPVTETAAGFRQGLAQPTYQRGAGSSFVPLQEKFYPAKQVDPFMKATPEQRVAMLPELEASQKPSSSLFTSTPGMLARNLGPKAEGQTLIPYRGETFRAFGEQLARDISDRPLVSGGLGLGGAVLGGLVGGIPGALIGGAIAPGVRAGQLGSISTLGRTARFSRGFPEALGEAQQMATRPQPMPGPVNPATIPSYPLTVQGPGQQLPPSVIPAPDLSRRVNIEGQPFTLPSQINTSQSQTARAMPTPQQMAIEKTQQIAQQTPRPVQQQAAQQVQQAPAPAPSQSMFAGQPSQAKAAPTPQPTPTEVTNLGKLGLREGKKAIKEAETSGVPTKFEMFEKGKGYTTYTFNKDITFKPDPDLKLNKAIEYNNGNKDFSGVLSSTGEPVTVKLVKNKDITVYNSSGDIIKQFDTKGNLTFEKKKGPSNVSQMLIDDEAGKTFNTLKIPENASQAERKIAGMTQANRDMLESIMKSELEKSKNPNDPTAKYYLSLFERYRLK